MKVLLLSSEHRGDLNEAVRSLLARGIGHDIKAIPTRAFGTVVWDFELWVDDDELPTAA